MKLQKAGLLRRLGLCFALFGALPAAAVAAPWFPLGPYGGDARSFAADPRDPHHLYLGTLNGWLYESHDSGLNWARVSQPGKRDDLVLEHVLVDPSDPKRLIVGAFRLNLQDGGVYISQDGGKHWYEQAQMRGQAVLSMARSDSNPHMIVTGTIKGIYRTMDDGTHWELISPPDNKEIHEVESLAIDPTNPKVIYAGTWHLPWKTEDGGETWKNNKDGIMKKIIDDSDVFSIILDPQEPSTVYLSACSGIYKSTDAATEFTKVQGIPSTARRTRKLLQDPTNRDTVYAGTTEGLYKTLDGGNTFTRMTNPNVVINDVYVDPSNPNHVLLATDRGGVLRSEDGGTTFEGSNTGFSSRQISSFASDPHNPSTLYVGVFNDKDFGGVFQSRDGGLTWEQQSTGLGGRDVSSLASTPGGTLLAGTSHGIFRLQPEGWVDSSNLTAAAVKSETVPTQPKPEPKQVPKPVHATASVRKTSPSKAAAAHKKPAALWYGRGEFHLLRVGAFVQPRTMTKHTQAKKPAPKPAARRTIHPVETQAPPPPSRLDSIVNSMAPVGDVVYAGTAEGLMQSVDDGHTWERISSLELKEVNFFAGQPGMLLASGPKLMAMSTDNGTTWEAVSPPSDITQIAAVCVDELKNLWVGGGEGVFYSADRGHTWKQLQNLYVHQVDDIYFDAPGHQVLVSSAGSNFAFAVHTPDYKPHNWDTGWLLRFVRPVGDHLIGATLFDGMVLQPQMVDTPFAAEK